MDRLRRLLVQFRAWWNHPVGTPKPPAIDPHRILVDREGVAYPPRRDIQLKARKPVA